MKPGLKSWTTMVLAAGLLALPTIVQAQGVVRGAQQGADVGNRAAGPVGGAVGGAVGAVGGGVVGGVKGVLGIPQNTHVRRSAYRHRTVKRVRAQRTTTTTTTTTAPAR